jgi:hypothetical protein
MKVVGLDGRPYNLNLVGYGPKDNPSAPHLRAREVLKALFPLDPRLEEVPLPGTGRLTLDFFLPTRKLAVEVQGEQHGTFVPFFHRTMPGFWASRRRDSRKEEFCERNGFRLVQLHDGTDEQWTALILGEST